MFLAKQRFFQQGYIVFNYNFGSNVSLFLAGGVVDVVSSAIYK